MKSSTILVAVFASLVGGAVGAFVVSQLAPAPEPATVPAPVAAEMEGYDDTALRGETTRNSDAIADLQAELIRIGARLDDLAEERDALIEENTKLKETAGETEPGGEVVTKTNGSDSGGESTPANPELEAEVDRAAAEALKKKDEQRRAEKEAATRKETEGWMGDASATITKKLDAELSLTQYQRDRINEIMANTTQRVADLMAAGKSDDSRESWDTIWRETNDAIRNEIGSAQQTTYDELVGERGIVSIAWEGK